MKKRFFFSGLLMTVLLLTFISPAYADGIIIPEPPICAGEYCPPPPLNQLEIRYHHVTVDIRDQIAITKIDQVFYNPSDWDVEGTYLFPVPLNAAVSQFKLIINGVESEAVVLDAEQARQIYQDIVYQYRDPALLEYQGRGAIQAHIFPIPPGEERRIQIEYQQVLTAQDGLVHYVYPLNTEKFSHSLLQSVSVEVNVHSNQPIRAIYSPSHTVDVARADKYTAVVSYEAANVLPDTDFDLYYSIGESEAFHLLTYRDPTSIRSQDGFFLMLLAPRPEIDSAPISKDIFLVLDRSGSMEGEKFRQAQTALTYILEHLNSNDRFYLMAFSNKLQTYAYDLRPASEASQAVQWVERLSASGSTDIQRALLETASAAEQSTRPAYLIFLTDGLPTSGVVNSNQIIADFQKAAPENLKLFTFGLGYDVDTVLLDSLSQDHHGMSTYVKPDEALDETLSTFYAGISTPVLTNLDIQVNGVDVYDLHPQPLPDLFAGSQILIAGRYQDGGTADIILQGEVNGEQQTFRFSQQVFPTDSRELNSLPRIWATRKIGTLLNQVRIEGANNELIDQIIRLSIEYGIITPYTSFLVSEDIPLGAEEMQTLSDKSLQEYQAAPPAASGMNAVQEADQAGEMSRAGVATELEGQSAQTVRSIGEHTFVRKDNIWIDTAFDPQTMKPRSIPFLSEEYYRLASNPVTAQLLSIGAHVIVILDGEAIEITVSEQAVVQPPLEEPIPTPTVVNTSAAPLPVDTPVSGASSTPLCGGALLPAIVLGGFLLHKKIR